MKTLKRFFSMLIIVALMVSAFVIPAQAASKQSTTELFVDSDGETIAQAFTSTADAKDAPKIDGYTYSSQSTKTTHVYAEQHIQYIIGYPDGGVKVEQSMTRAEAVVVLYRLYNGNYPAFTKRMSNNTFADVDSAAWYYKELECLHNAGIISDAGNFRPNEPITRAEFATLCARYDGLEFLDKAKFSDVKTGHWAYSYINAAAEKGWIIGYPDGTFRPDNSITRAEVMTLVNRLFNRAPTAEQISDVKNPYNDIVSTHWAYCDVVEATVKHDMADWHGAKYNDGIYNIVIEKFVDSKGKEISKAVTAKSSANHHPAEIKGYSYLGYITVLTYVYTNGKPIPGITKTAGVSTASVGDSVIYTVTLTNGKDASAPWIDVTMVDEVPQHMSFVHGSVYLNGSHTDYNLVDGLLSVAVGNIEAGKTAKIIFEMKVLSTGYGATITNEATGTGSNGGPVSDKDDGITVNQGKIRPYITKAPNVSSANVGQTITYTLGIGNAAGATYPWESAVITDVIPTGLSFVDGSVYLDGVSKTYSYNNGTLTVALGDIAPGKSHTLTFKAVVQESAYGKTIYNTAVGTGDNTPDIEAPDTGVIIKNGTVEPYAAKRADKSVASVGDTILYTVTVGNSRFATEAWKNVVMTDTLSGYLTFVHGSVQVNGQSAGYSYSGGVLTVPLGDINPHTEKVVTFEAVVNSTAYNTTIRNTAIMTGDNTTDPVEASDEGVSVGKGSSEGTATKTANVSTAQTGDIITYTVQVKNSSLATCAWENATITDAIPAYLTFVDGSVQIGGTASTSYSYSGTTLKIFLGNIAPGATVTATFRCKVNADAQGQFIVNTAYVSGDNHDTLPAPDKGVEIGSGSAMPSAIKSANVQSAVVGDIITYTITAANNIKATADWKNVILSDVLPDASDFVHGSVYVNGTSATYSYAGHALTVRLGDIVPGESVRITFQAKITSAAQGHTLYNVAHLDSDNSPQIIVSDDGVTVPNETYGGDANKVYGNKVADKISVRSGDFITYTIVAGNSSENDFTWYDVHLYDIIDTSLTKIVIDTVTIDGRKANAAEVDYYGGQLIVKLGTIEPGQEVTVTFKVKVTSEAAGELIGNTATLKGSNASGGTYNTSVRISLVTDVPAQEEPGDTKSDIHVALFDGYGFTMTVYDSQGNSWEEVAGDWGPNDPIKRGQLAAVFYRLLTKPSFSGSVSIADIDTSYWAYTEVQFALARGLFTLDESNNFYPTDRCTEADLGRFFVLVDGTDYGFASSASISRINVAKAIIDHTSRSKRPIINSASLPSFTDIPTSHTNYWEVMEVSTSHDWYLDSDGKEYWDN